MRNVNLVDIALKCVYVMNTDRRIRLKFKIVEFTNFCTYVGVSIVGR